MLKHFKPKIRSRHPSHNILRKEGIFPLFPFKSVIRLGSTTVLGDTISEGGNRVEINEIDAIKNSSNKLLMKQCFTNEKVKTADWWIYGGPWDQSHAFMPNGVTNERPDKLSELPFPIISKHIHGSRNKGNKKHDTIEQLMAWLSTKDSLDNYIFEKFYNFVREYRIHVTENGYFYTCRKMLKSNTPQKDKWYRNDEHCVWVMEENEIFDKPTSWKMIVNHSIKALKSVGLDFGAVDIKVQSATTSKGKKRKKIDFIIIEINSAPSFGVITATKYINMLSHLILNKFNKK